MKRLQSISYKTLFAILFFSLAGIVFFLKIGGKTQKVSAAWWDEMWHYRKAISISNTSGSNLTDFQVSISIGTSQLIADGKMQTDCDDIRITDINGNLLPYWIDPDLGCNSTSNTVIYTKFSSLISGDNTAYVYYGNPSANNVQDGASVYPQLFDTFDGTTINGDKYKYGGGGTFTQNNFISIINNNVTWDNYLYNNTTYTRDSSMVFYSKLKCDANSYTMIGWHDNSAGVSYTDLVYAIYFSSGNLMVWEDGTNRGSFGTLTNGTWYDIKIELKSTGAKYYYKAINTPNWTLIYDSSYSSESNLRPGIAVYNTTYSYIDDWRIGKYISTEPTVTPQSEETGGGPIAYWKFDEGIGNTAFNSASNQNNGIISGATWLDDTQCINGKCLSFDNIDDVISTPYINLTNTFTVSLWIKANSFNPTTDDGILSECESSTIGKCMHLVIRAGKPYLGFYGNDLSSNTTLETNKWYHLTYLYDGTKQKIYINGNLDASKNATPFNGQSGIIYVGKSYNSSSYVFDGNFDELKIYPYARTADQIKLDYNSRGSLSGSGTNLGNQDTSGVLISDGLVGYWKLDGDINDSSPNNLTTNFSSTQPDLVTAKIGQGYQFNGLPNQYIYTPPNNLLNFTNKFTAGFWLKINGSVSSTYQAIIGESLDSSWGLYGSADGNTLTLRTVTSSGTVNVPFSFTTNEWNYVTIIYNGSNIYVYINNSLIASSTQTGNLTHTGNNITIGGISDRTGYYFNGTLDDVRLYNRDLSTSEITQLYNRTPSRYKSSLIAHYKFDENTGTTVYDSSGNNLNGTFGTGSFAPTWTQGKIGKALNFDGSDDFLSITDNDLLDTSNDYTISMWVYNQAGAKSWPTLLNRASSSSNNGYFWIYTTGTNGSNINFQYADGTNYHTENFNNALRLNSWDHISFTFNNSTKQLKLYINGKQFSTTRTLTNPLPVDDGSLYIGTYQGNSTSYPFKGLIDEIKIYNRTLTDDEVKQDYNQGSAISFGSTTQTIGATTTSLEYCIPGDTSYCAPPIAEWKMDEGVGTSIVDTSGNNYTSTFIGTPTWNQGKIGKSITFNGSNNAIQLSGPATSPHETLSSWVYIDSSSPNGDIVGNCHTNANQHYGFTLYLDGNNLRAKAATNADTYFFDNVYYDISSFKDKWIHLSMVWDNLGTGTGGCDTNVKLLINGQIVDEATHNVSSGSYNCTYPYPYPFSMGGTTVNSLTRTTKVKLDQVRVYNYARTPAQIAYDYNKGGPVGWWKFDECQGNIAYDWSGIGNTGTITIGASGTQNSLGTCAVGTSAAWTNGASGHINSSLNLDGTDDYVDAGTNPSLNFGTTDYSISLWAKRNNLTGTQILVDKRASEYVGFVVFFSGTNLYLRGNGSGHDVSLTSAITDTRWHQITITNYRKGEKAIFIDGIKRQSIIYDSSSLDINSNYSLKFSKEYSQSNYFFNGQIDDVRIYNYALTAEQVKQVYNGGSVSFN